MDEIYLVYRADANGRHLIGEFMSVLSASAEIEKQVRHDRETGENNGYEIERKALKGASL